MLQQLAPRSLVDDLFDQIGALDTKVKWTQQFLQGKLALNNKASQGGLGVKQDDNKMTNAKVEILAMNICNVISLMA